MKADKATVGDTKIPNGFALACSPSFIQDMTITQDPSAPLLAVVGSTGIQGGSVISALAFSTSRSYRVRALTRDTGKDSAVVLEKHGCQVVAADVNNARSLMEAFDGAQIVFAMTVSDYFATPFKETVSWNLSPFI